MRLNAVIAAWVQEPYQPIARTQTSAAHVEHLGIGKQAFANQGIKLQPARTLEEVRRTAGKDSLTLDIVSNLFESSRLRPQRKHTHEQCIAPVK